MSRSITTLLLAAATLAPAAAEEVLFQSATLGPTGISEYTPEAPGTNINPNRFQGARFELTTPVLTSRIGGHFAQGDGTGGDFFGALVALTGPGDFPDSSDLSTPDVLGSTTLTFPDPSDEVYGELELALQPGWYGVVFGSGLFGTSSITGGAVRNGDRLAGFDYMIWSLGGGGTGWSSPLTRNDGNTFFLRGMVVPEPSTYSISMGLLGSLALRRRG